MGSLTDRVSRRKRGGQVEGAYDENQDEGELFEADADGMTDGRGLEQSDLIENGAEPTVGDDASALAAEEDGVRVDGTAKIEEQAPVSKGEAKIQAMIERLRAKQEELTHRLAEKQEKRVSRPAPGSAAKPTAKATSVPGMFPRQPSVGRIWAIVQQRQQDGKVELSINAITKELDTNRSTVKGAFKALSGAGILVDTTPTLNAAHTYEVHDPFAGQPAASEQEGEPAEA